MSSIEDATRLLEQITPGEWEAEDIGAGSCAWGVVARGTDGESRIVVMHDFVGPTDAEFIAKAPDLIRSLLSERARLEGERDQLLEEAERQKECEEAIIGCAKHWQAKAEAAEQSRAWQPIETMPRSGPAVLVYWGCDINGEASIDMMRFREYQQCVSYGEPPATHWQPLPPSPETRTEGEEREE